MIPDSFKDPSWAKGVVVESLGLTDDDDEPSDLEANLEAAAGTDSDGGKVYRPYYNCAQYLDTKDTKRAPLATKNVSLRDYDKRIAGYRAQQAALDAAFGLIVPPGASAAPSGSGSVPRSTSVPTVVVF